MAQSAVRERRPRVPDKVGAAAAQVALDAVVADAGEGAVGDHLGVVPEDGRVVTHRFACRLAGYVGWEWHVTLSRVPRARTVTVDEVVLLPGPHAIVAPAWVPFSERVRPGDIAPGVVLPTAPDDPRLDPGVTSLPAVATLADLPVEAVADLVADLGLLRARLLSLAGQDDADERWSDGPGGPADPIARAAPHHCRDCGFRVPLTGRLGTRFGVCANVASPRDGAVVSLDYGCGAHSEIRGHGPAAQFSLGTPFYDTVGEDELALR